MVGSILALFILSHAAMAFALDKPKIKEVDTAGVISGFDCAVYRIVCPATHRGFDMATPGILTEDGGWYFVVNVPASFLGQFFLDKIHVVGDVYMPYDHAIEPHDIYLANGDKKELVFTKGRFIDSEGHRSTFMKGEFDGENWVCKKCAKKQR